MSQTQAPPLIAALRSIVAVDEPDEVLLGRFVPGPAETRAAPPSASGRPSTAARSRRFSRSWLGATPAFATSGFAPDGKTLYGTARTTLYVWDVAKPQELRSFTHPFNPVAGDYPVAGDGHVILASWLPPPAGANSAVRATHSS